MVRVGAYRRQSPYELAKRFGSAFHCETPKGAFGRCFDISEQLLEYLQEKGIEARLLRGAGFRKKLGAGAVTRWQVTPKKELVHHVVLVDDTVIDLTGSQFGHEYGDITYPLDVFKERWKFVVAYPEKCEECGEDEDSGDLEYHKEDAEYLQGNPEEDVL